jgi:hypothetical protein
MLPPWAPPSEVDLVGLARGVGTRSGVGSAWAVPEGAAVLAWLGSVRVFVFCCLCVRRAYFYLFFLFLFVVFMVRSGSDGLTTRGCGDGWLTVWLPDLNQFGLFRQIKFVYFASFKYLR